MTSLTQERLKDLFSYNPDDGKFTRLKYSAWNAKKGDIPSYKNNRGYLLVNIDYKMRSHHRLAFLYMTGEIPEGQIDHINHIRDDNRWCNLRVVSRLENKRNKSMDSRNTSGVNGIRCDKRCNTWSARIKMDGKENHLGSYKERWDAICARMSANHKYGFHANHGNILKG